MYLISFKEAQFAHTFVDYMATKGVSLRIELDNDGNSQLFLNVKDKDKLELITEELKHFVKDPYNKRYLDATWQQGERHHSEIKNSSLKAILPRFVSVGPVTLVIALICVVLYLLLLVVGPRVILAYLGYPFFENNDQLWRYITPIFIHFSLLHIVFNLMWWWYLGGMIEKLRGKLKLIEITFVSGILSNYAEASVSSPYFGGLSGVVYALMGYVWLYGERLPSSGLRFDRTMIGIALIWLVAGFTGVLGSIANTAHLIGLIVGLLLAAKDIWLLKK